MTRTGIGQGRKGQEKIRTRAGQGQGRKRTVQGQEKVRAEKRHRQDTRDRSDNKESEIQILGYGLWTRTRGKEFRHKKKDRDIQNNQKLTGGYGRRDKIRKIVFQERNKVGLQSAGEHGGSLTGPII